LGRVLKTVEDIPFFDSLFFLIRSIRASALVFFWTFLFLCFVMVCMGLLINQLLYPALMDENIDIDMRKRLFMYYGTWFRTSATMLELTFANWTPAARFLMDEIGSYYVFLIGFYRCFFMFGLLEFFRLCSSLSPIVS